MTMNMKSPATLATLMPLDDLIQMLIANEHAAIEALTRRQFLTGALAAAVLLACGDDGGSESDNETREVEDMFGNVEVPVRPQKVVAVGATATANMIFLGSPPLGGMIDTKAHPAGIHTHLEDVIDVGDDGESDLQERILSLGADLVIAVGGNRNSDWGREQCESLAKAIPTFCYQQDYTFEEDFKASIKSIATAIGQEERADDLFKEYDERVAGLRDRLAAAGLNDHVVASVYISEDGSYFVSWGGSEGVAFRSLGLSLPDWQSDPGEFGMTVSLEQVNLLEDVDTLFINSYDVDLDDQKAHLAEPIWQTLKAVQNDSVYFVDFAAWMGTSFPALVQVFDDIERLLIVPAEQ